MPSNGKYQIIIYSYINLLNFGGHMVDESVTFEVTVAASNKFQL